MGKDVGHDIAISDDGKIILKKKSNVKRGRKGKTSGSLFELRVRKDLEGKKWIVSKWPNNIEDEKIIPSKRVFKRFNKNMGVMTIGTGFPDFIAFQKINNLYKVIGIEAKSSGILKKEEKEKCAWYLKNEIFNEIWIAKKIDDGGRKVNIEYVNFAENYPKYMI